MTRQTCGIYTRKSTEEGLEQDFNSLDAQRAACEAFIKSQAGEGWRTVKRRYDDGGYSGATLERPALQALLEDMKTGRISIVVVYKVDRLTRSLTDFAKLVELFDKHDVSFVSVTQQFNTTSSMGRLTLNVLLSFAQFEREVTAERIRDKIAQSKKKGLWMGGVVPLGYDVKDRKLIVNEAEADTVRTLFGLYLQCGTINQVKEEADRLGLMTKARKPNNGSRPGGVPFTRGHLYKLLENPIYAGYITHKGAKYEGEHQAIIDLDDWEKVQSRLTENAVGRHHDKNLSTRSLLTGKLVDETGAPLVPTYAKKGDCRYRYYISLSLKGKRCDKDKGWRLPATPIEAAVTKAISNFLADRPRLVSTLKLDRGTASQLTARLAKAALLSRELRSADAARQRQILLDLVKRIDLEPEGLRITLKTLGLIRALHLKEHKERVPSDPALTIPIQFKRRGVEAKLIIEANSARTGSPDAALIKTIKEARIWYEELRRGEVSSVAALAQRHNTDRANVGKTLPLAFLAPSIVEAILDGRQPAELTASRLKRETDLPLSWQDQARLLTDR